MCSLASEGRRVEREEARILNRKSVRAARLGGKVAVVRTGITPAEALQIVLEHAPLLGAETLAVADARGRVLVEGVRSNRRLPPSDNSAMDGFAVRSEDLASASADHPVALEVIYEIPAGGSCGRIF